MEFLHFFLNQRTKTRTTSRLYDRVQQMQRLINSTEA